MPVSHLKYIIAGEIFVAFFEGLAYLKIGKYFLFCLLKVIISLEETKSSQILTTARISGF